MENEKIIELMVNIGKNYTRLEQALQGDLAYNLCGVRNDKVQIMHQKFLEMFPSYEVYNRKTKPYKYQIATYIDGVKIYAILSEEEAKRYNVNIKGDLPYGDE